MAKQQQPPADGPDPADTIGRNRDGIAASKTYKRATAPTQPIALAQHTPGPWWIDDSGFIAAGGGDSYVTVADAHCRSTADAGDEMEANARLIAAAPDMLGALQQMARSFAAVGDGIFPNEAKRIRAAIAKATGGKP